MVWMKRLAMVLLVAALAACGGEEAPEGASQPAGGEPSGGMEGMQGMEDMQGMSGRQMGGGMMEQMRAHMQQMQDKSGDQIKADLAQHRQMVANMISQFNREMRDMGMATDQEWNSTVEALRADLRRMPEMSAQDLQTLMPEHRERVMRLMEMHRAMME